MRTLITSDCHVSTPWELLNELPESYRTYFRRIEHREDGDYVVAPGARATMGGTMDGPPATKIDAHGALRMAVGACDEAEPSFEPAQVLADLERDGVTGAVLITGLGVPQGDPERPVDADIAYARLVNDWNAEHWAPYLDRVAPGIVLPYRDVAATVAELERCAALGMRPALMPDGIGDAPYHLPMWEPLWEAASALQIPITMHVGTRQTPAQRGAGADAAAGAGLYKGLAFVGWYQQCWMMGETLGWLTFSGVFERHPDLHVVMTEGYAGWLGFAMEFWDHHWDSRFGSQHELNVGELAPKLDAPPSYYLKRQAHATFMWDPTAITLRERTGIDCLLWGNDYPHREGSFPWSQEWVDKQFAGVPEDEVVAMTSGNAAKLFKITV